MHRTGEMTLKSILNSAAWSCPYVVTALHFSAFPGMLETFKESQGESLGGGPSDDKLLNFAAVPVTV